MSLLHNYFDGKIPYQITNLRKVWYLNLGANLLLTPDWSMFSAMPLLTHLSFNHNYGLTSGFPGFILDCHNLTVLDLSKNKFNGTIPESLFTNLGKLELLYLFENLFHGPLSPNISHLSKLKYLRLGINQLSGLIPEDIGAILNLRIIGMYNNSLEGRIPSSIGQLKGLSILRLGVNSLNCTIPHELGFCTNLTELNLATNSFSGEIPPEIGLLTKLQILSLYNN